MINPIEFSGVIQRTQDISALKQNEDVRPQFEHINVQNKTEQEAIIRHEQVNEKDNADREKDHFDAKEKGNGQYYRTGKHQKRNKNEEDEDGRVVKKGQNRFDVHI